MSLKTVRKPKPVEPVAAAQPTEAPVPPPAHPHTHPRARTVAPLLFTRYNETGPNPGVTWDGKDVPPWEKLSTQVIMKWTGVADLVARAEDNAYLFGRRQGILLVLRPLLIAVLMAVTIGLSAVASVALR